MNNIVVVGAGPAGLAAAEELCRLGVKPLVLEARKIIGGLSATHRFGQYRFDVGGHRFFTRSPMIEERWQEWMGDDFLVRPRLSRIYFRGEYFHYPLQPLETFSKLGLVESSRILASYFNSKMRPRKPEGSFEDWICNRFGDRLFNLFFRTYTEKVWGMPCSDIGADWASQRIRNLDLPRAVMDSLRIGAHRGKSETEATLVRSFHYPRKGPGQLWETVADRVSSAGGEVRLNTSVESIHVRNGQVINVDVVTDGKHDTLEMDALISSMPLSQLIRTIKPTVPERIRQSAAALRYRDFITVGLVIKKQRLFPDQWLYIHSDEVRVGRIQNYNNWSRDMCPEEGVTLLGFEYFVNRGEDLWDLDDGALIALATREGNELGLIDPRDVVDGTVIRAEKAYPVYDTHYRGHLATIHESLRSIANLWTVGRNGLHRYNNQDHSMLTGIYAARNAILRSGYDVWNVNTEKDYHESTLGTEPAADRLVPVSIRD